MNDLKLEIKLLSDTTFGRGDRHAGVVEQEVEYDARTGLPFIKGRTLKGLLVEECANILYAVQESSPDLLPTLKERAKRLFGQPGSGIGDQAILRFGNAQLPDDFRHYMEAEITNQKYRPDEVLEALTTIRRQTAVDNTTGAPKDNSLRGARAILRDTVFYASLSAREDLSPDELALLAACAAAVRRAGTSRNRGRGRLDVRLIQEDDRTFHDTYLQRFTAAITGRAGR